MPGGVEVRLGPTVGNEGAVHLWSGHVQFVLLERDEKHEMRRRESTDDEGGCDVWFSLITQHNEEQIKYTFQGRGYRSTRSAEIQFPTQGHWVRNEIVNCEDWIKGWSEAINLLCRPWGWGGWVRLNINTAAQNSADHVAVSQLLNLKHTLVNQRLRIYFLTPGWSCTNPMTPDHMTKVSCRTYLLPLRTRKCWFKCVDI